MFTNWLFCPGLRFAFVVVVAAAARVATVFSDGEHRMLPALSFANVLELMQMRAWQGAGLGPARARSRRLHAQARRQIIDLPQHSKPREPAD